MFIKMFINNNNMQTIKKINSICLNSTNEYCKKLVEQNTNNKKIVEQNTNNKKIIEQNTIDLIKKSKNFTSSNNIIPIFCFLSVSSFLFYLYNKK